MTDIKCGGFIVTMPDALDQYVMVNGKRVYFEYSKWLGPTVIEFAGGEPMKRQPGQRNPFWPKFEEWLDHWWTLQPYFWAPNADGKPAHHWQEKPTGYQSRCGRSIGHGGIIWRSKEKRHCAACQALAPTTEKRT